jgi:hypothetical protein
MMIIFSIKMLCEAGISTVQYLLTQKEGTVLHLWYIQCVHMSGMHTLVLIITMVYLKVHTHKIQQAN